MMEKSFLKKTTAFIMTAMLAVSMSIINAGAITVQGPNPPANVTGCTVNANKIDGYDPDSKSYVAVSSESNFKSNLSSGKALKLTNNITLKSNTTYSLKKGTSIYLNGKTLSVPKGSAINIASNGVEIFGANNGKIKSCSGSGSVKHLIYTSSNISNVNIRNTTITANGNSASAIKINSDVSNVSLTGLDLSSTNANYATVDLDGVTNVKFTNNNVDSNSRGYFLNNCNKVKIGANANCSVSAKREGIRIEKSSNAYIGAGSIYMPVKSDTRNAVFLVSCKNFTIQKIKPIVTEDFKYGLMGCTNTFFDTNSTATSAGAPNFDLCSSDKVKVSGLSNKLGVIGSVRMDCCNDIVLNNLTKNNIETCNISRLSINGGSTKKLLIEGGYLRPDYDISIKNQTITNISSNDACRIKFYNVNVNGTSILKTTKHCTFNGTSKINCNMKFEGCAGFLANKGVILTKNHTLTFEDWSNVNCSNIVKEAGAKVILE